MSEFLRDLAIANRVLAHEGVVDAFGHVSIRHPERSDRYFMARSRAPELVTVADLMEFELDGTPVDARGRTPYAERFIHGAIYEQRKDVHSVIHNHSHEIIPYGVTPIKLRPILHVGAAIGDEVPVWDIRKKFGDPNRRGAVGRQGCAVAGKTLREAVFTAIYLQVNAKLQTQAMNLSDQVQYLSTGELARTKEMLSQELGLQRAWEYWTMRANREGIE
jgi:HCOMODA/2-hydroxy-3-carboxy-muconic semialdehyde decarboxylase